MREKAVRMAVVVLAAGRASRFGSAKLLAPLHGRPVIEHVAQSLACIPFAYRLCVATQGGAELAHFGFDMIEVEQGLPQSASLAAGIMAAQRLGAESAMVVLGDMPLVPPSHLAALISAFDGEIVASSTGQDAMPPAIFGKRHFAGLAAIEGDSGARELLKQAPLVLTSPHDLLDIDTPDDLLRAQAIGGRIEG